MIPNMLPRQDGDLIRSARHYEDEAHKRSRRAAEAEQDPKAAQQRSMNRAAARLTFGVAALAGGTVRRGRLASPIWIQLAEWEEGM
ncbi:hypothetical protein [Paenibacillus sp. YYML68]|uniref:hypothetical protein n=1 Tax=Paenibacillus sp. YYML68 TaxID=2909250 RepID=UPI00249105CF|nr:hypothetical protein [Paenibacillus sp. YYML68]